ncbi:SHD1 domain-containing protein [Aeoliella sp. SH292]|uniref:SHD1 domain-containing protein n=1 Tax=Aeoliella sp. SH292 TaxID=3454464 RepID=UPI003F9E1647
MNRLTTLFATLIVLTTLATASAADYRTWTDTSGKYTLKAALVAQNNSHVVLERESDKGLGSIAIDQLSEADQKYLESQEATKAATTATGGMQKWSLKNGTEIVGKVVNYGRKQIVLRRSRGRIYVNDRVLTNLPGFYQNIIPLIVAHAGNQVTDERTLVQWLSSRRGGPESFTVDGVVMELEDGDEYAIPFFLFSDKDLTILRPGWEQWLSAYEQKDAAAREQQELRLQTEAAYHQQQQDAAQQRRIAQLQLGFTAVAAGVTSVWEVTLIPEPGNPGPPLWLSFFARDSRSAAMQAMAAHPGYSVGPIRRVGG